MAREVRISSFPFMHACSHPREGDPRETSRVFPHSSSPPPPPPPLPVSLPVSRSRPRRPEIVVAEDLPSARTPFGDLFSCDLVTPDGPGLAPPECMTLSARDEPFGPFSFSMRVFSLPPVSSCSSFTLADSRASFRSSGTACVPGIGNLAFCKTWFVRSSKSIALSLSFSSSVIHPCRQIYLGLFSIVPCVRLGLFIRRFYSLARFYPPSAFFGDYTSSPIISEILCSAAASQRPLWRTHFFSSFVIWKHIVVETLVAVVLVCGHVLSYDSSRLSSFVPPKGSNK